MHPALSETRTSLLRLQDQRDIDAWDQFVAIYQPLVFRLAQAKGFQEADAHDIVPEVMLAVSRAIHRWEPDPAQGRFRDWLFRIARNMMINFLTRRKHQSLASGHSVAELLEQEPDGREHSAEATRQFELEYRRELFRQAAPIVISQVRSTTWDAFRLTALEQLTISQTAEQLGLTEGAVLVARCRVLAGQCGYSDVSFARHRPPAGQTSRQTLFASRRRGRVVEPHFATTAAAPHQPTREFTHGYRTSILGLVSAILQ